MKSLIVFCAALISYYVEGLLVPAPYYGSFLLDLRTRSRVVPFSVELSSKVSKDFNIITIQLLQKIGISFFRKFRSLTLKVGQILIPDSAKTDKPLPKP